VQLLVDLLRIEHDPAQWEPVAMLVASEVERRAVLGQIDSAAELAVSILSEQQSIERPQLAQVSSALADTLAAGPLIRHVVLHLRKADDHGVAAAARLCHTLGRAAVRPLAEALAVEEHHRAIRSLREILLEFGAVGRTSVEQLKNSPNPAVRRTAIDLLRVFGGDEALPELASMLGDADPQVQRESIRAIVQIGTEAAYAVLQRALSNGSDARDTIVHQLIALRDDKAIPLLCLVLTQTPPRGALVTIHTQIIEALGTHGAHPESTRTLRLVLHRGAWWAPFKTARFRDAAASALLRIGSADTLAVLEEAGQTGSRQVRRVARAKISTAGARRPQEQV
jgi:HEAT repeat protein